MYAYYDRAADIAWLPTGEAGTVVSEEVDWGLIDHDTTTVGLPGVDRVPPQALLLVSITSVQFGSALARGLFDDVGPAGTVFLRMGFAAVVLVALVRPAMRGLSPTQVRIAVIFGAVMAAFLDHARLGFIPSYTLIPLVTGALATVACFYMARTRPSRTGRPPGRST